jgi:hypothetical protein
VAAADIVTESLSCYVGHVCALGGLRFTEDLAIKAAVNGNFRAKPAEKLNRWLIREQLIAPGSRCTSQ